MNTAVFNVRMDVRDLATIFDHYTNQGIEIKSISTLTRRVVEFVAQSLVEQKGAKSFGSTTEAYQYFEALGLMGPLRIRGSQSIVKGLQMDSLAMEGFSTDYIEKKGLNTVDPDQVRKATELLEERLKEKSSGAILGKSPGEVKE